MKWFVAYTKSRCEAKASDFFKKNGVESYVPVFVEKRQWSDRVKKNYYTRHFWLCFF